MLRSVNSLIGYTIRASDGDLGKVIEFFFDDETWAIRYLVVKTAGWLSGRKVLVSPVALGEADWESRALRVSLTMAQVRASPEIDTEIPISRQYERRLYGHYRWPVYWGSGVATGGMFMPSSPVLSFEATAPTEEAPAEPEGEQFHLRSTHSVAGYHVAAIDGDIGHVEDYIIDDQSWLVRFLVVDTRNWLPGRRVLIAPQWVKRVAGRVAEVTVDLSREAIKGSPEFDPTQPVNLDYEGRLHDYYGRPLREVLEEPARVE